MRRAITVAVLLGASGGLLAVPAHAAGTASPSASSWPAPGAGASARRPEQIAGSPRKLQGDIKPLVLIDQRKGKNGKPYLSLPTDVLFAYNSATLDGAAAATIKQTAADLKNAGATGDVQVIGHTDDTGTASYNLKLSKHRAAAVAQALQPLLSNSGIHLKVSGVGETHPLVSNSSKAGKQRNRAVVIEYSSGSTAQPDENDISVPMSQQAPSGSGYGQGVSGAVASTQKTIDLGTDGRWTVRIDVTDLRSIGKLLWVGFYVTPVSSAGTDAFSSDDVGRLMSGSLSTQSGDNVALYDTKARQELQGVHDDKGTWILNSGEEQLAAGQRTFAWYLFPKPTNGDTAGLSLYIPAFGALTGLKVQN